MSHADFAPDMKGYTGQGAFRFWCQKVMPLVYDDSLSYYEVLCKVVNYLNNTIKDVANVEDNVQGLYDAYVLLQGYVNDYFDNLDVQNEINNKLDSMARSGELDALLHPYVVSEVTSWLDENVTPTGSVVTLDKSLSIEGSAADAKATGDAIDNVWDNLEFWTDIINPEITQNEYVDDATGVFTPYLGYVRTGYIPVTEGRLYYTGISDNLYYNAFYDENKTFISRIGIFSYRNFVQIPANAKYIAISDTAAHMSGLKLKIQSISTASENASTALEKITAIEDVVAETVTLFEKTGVGFNKLNNEYVYIAKDLPIPTNSVAIFNAETDVVGTLELLLFAKNANNTYRYIDSIECDTSSGVAHAEFFADETTFIGFHSTSGGITYGSTTPTVAVDRCDREDVGDETAIDITQDIGFYFTLSVVKSRGNQLVIVSKDGKGTYDNIVTAMNAEPEGTPIYVFPGVYEQDMTECLAKRVILIGVDRNQCIIRDTDGRYGHHALYVSCGYFENLTIEEKYVSGTSQEIGTENGGYAVHIDTDSDYAVGKQIEFHHCNISSDFFPAIGCGLRKDMTLIIDDCKLYNGQVAGRGNYTDDGTLGALYVHDSNGTQGNQYVDIKDSVFRSKLGKAMCIYQVDRDPQNNRVICNFINNVVYSDVNKFANNIWLRGDPFDASTGIYSIDIGYGNSNAILNS